MDYWNISKKYWKLGILVFILIFGAIITYTFLAQPVYDARSLVMVTSQDQTSVLLGSTIARIDIETQREIIMSASVLESIYSEYGIDDFEINVEPIKNTNVIEINIEAKDAESAMKIANKVAEAYVFFTRESKRQDALEVEEFINEQLKEYQKEIDELTLQSGDYEVKKGNLELEIENIENLISDYNNNRNIYKKELEVLTIKVQNFESESGLSTADKLEYEAAKEEIIEKESLYNDAVLKSRVYSEMLTSKQQELLDLASSDEANNKGLTQNIAAKQKIYDYLLSRGEEVGIVAKEKGGNVKIIEYASLSRFPIKPNFILNFALGILIAFIASISAVFLKDSIKNNFRNKKEIEERIGPVIGNIKKIRRKQMLPYQIIGYESVSSFRDDINRLRTNLLFRIKDKKIKMISVTSPGKGDGKSTIAANLAISLAKSGKKVIIVDTNLRRPILGRAFQIKDKEPGLTDVITDSAKLDKVIKIRKTIQDNLFLLPAGQQMDTNHNLLATDKMNDICGKLEASDFDYVIYDNTSLKYPESLSMCANSGGVILIITTETDKETAEEAKAELEKANSNLIGVVVNFSKT